MITTKNSKVLPSPRSFQSHVEYNRTCKQSLRCSGNALQQEERETPGHWAGKVLGTGQVVQPCLNNRDI